MLLKIDWHGIDCVYFVSSSVYITAICLRKYLYIKQSREWFIRIFNTLKLVQTALLCVFLFCTLLGVGNLMEHIHVRSLVFAIAHHSCMLSPYFD